MLRRPSSDYREYRPDAGLEAWIACTWSQTIGDGDAEFLQRVLPDGCADVVWIGDAGARAVGPATASVVEVLPPGTSVVGVRFRPGAAAAALDVPAFDLRDRQPKLEELWGQPARALDERVLEATGLTAKLAAAESGIRVRLVTARVPDAIVLAVAANIELYPDACLERALTEVGLSERQLRRRFREEVGYGPKTFQRIARLRRLLALAASDRSLSALAMELGYADQAHMTREVATLAGISPAQLVARAPVLQAVSDPFDVRNLQDRWVRGP